MSNLYPRILSFQIQFCQRLFMLHFCPHFNILYSIFSSPPTINVHTDNDNDWERYNNHLKDINNKIQDLKCNEWQSLCSELNLKSNQTTIYKIMKAINNITASPSSSAIKENIETLKPEDESNSPEVPYSITVKPIMDEDADKPLNGRNITSFFKNMSDIKLSICKHSKARDTSSIASTLPKMKQQHLEDSGKFPAVKHGGIKSKSINYATSNYTNDNTMDDKGIDDAAMESDSPSNLHEKTSISDSKKANAF